MFETFVIKAVTDASGLALGFIYDVYKDGKKQGSFFAQCKRINAGDRVNMGINSRYLPSPNA